MQLREIDILRNQYYERILEKTKYFNNPNIKKIIDFIFWDNGFFQGINKDDAVYDLDDDSEFNKKYDYNGFSFYVKKDNISISFDLHGSLKEIYAVNICVDKSNYWNKPKDAFIQLHLKHFTNRDLKYAEKLLTRFFKYGGKRKNPFLEQYKYSDYGYYHIGRNY